MDIFECLLWTGHGSGCYAKSPTEQGAKSRYGHGLAEDRAGPEFESSTSTSRAHGLRGPLFLVLSAMTNVE